MLFIVFRLMVCYLVVAFIIGANMSANFKEQIFVTLVIYELSFLFGKWKKDKEEPESKDKTLTTMVGAIFIATCVYGLVLVWILQKWSFTSGVINSIINYELITKPALNLTSGVLVAIIGYFGGKERVGDPPEEYV